MSEFSGWIAFAKLPFLSEFLVGVLPVIGHSFIVKVEEGLRAACHLIVRLIAFGEVGAEDLRAKHFPSLLGHVRGDHGLLSEFGGSGLLGLGSLLGGAGVLTLREIGAGVLGAESVHGGLVA